LAFGWTDPKPPAIFATLLVRWLSFRSKQYFYVLLSISNRQTQHQSPNSANAWTLAAIFGDTLLVVDVL
jgi:hypothetical protein